MKDFITYITNYHVNVAFIFTPLCKTQYNLEGKTLDMWYLFGFRIIRINVSK